MTYHKAIISVVAILLSSIMFYSCRTINNETSKPINKEESVDSTKEFVPLHPPVVIPHSWKEAK